MGETPNSSQQRLVVPVLRLGAAVGRYQLRRELGAGGMGVVYEAFDPQLQRPVAVKVLRSSLDRERFTREARALAKLSHPNVVAIYDVETVGELAFIAMELVEGATLKAWASERPRSLGELLSVALQAGRGLAAAHAAGLLHRDFKPDNVMVGSDGRARVLDFGIVQPIEPGVAAAEGFAGTPAYMAPEQFRDEAVGPAADQFGFCVALWELAHGERPFSPDMLLERARGGDVGGPREPARAHAVPRWLRRILERGMAPESASRYPSMVALLRAIEAEQERQALELELLGRRYEVLPRTMGESELALDRLTGRVVTVKYPSAGRDAPSRAELSRAFRTLAALRHRHLAPVLDFGFGRDGAPYWVLELRDTGHSLHAAASRPGARSLVEYLIQVTHALHHLHQRGMSLGELEPEAVVVVDDEAKLIPLAAGWSKPDVGRDLSAFGRFALQQLALSEGRAPESFDDGERLLATLEVEPRVADVLARLLRGPAPGAFASAREVAGALAEIVGQPRFVGHESGHHVAPLLGRSDELASLEASVLEACAGRGAAWWINGESGAGKSRLLEEIGTMGAVHGALVLRGQEEREGGSPYRLFRDVLYGLTLLTDLDDGEASVLVPVLPKLSAQLKRPLAPAPELDALSTHARLVGVVQSILRRQERPLVLLLEDLQWARSDSVDLLRRIVEDVTTRPLLVVAAGREGEPAGLASSGALQVLQVGRLSQTALAEIAECVIGRGARRPELLALLERESEGNPFFLVEVLRALAEKAGGFERIGEAPLPEKVFAEGIQGRIREQLRAVPREARELLRLAAVVGRRIDRSLLATLAPQVDLDDGLSRCIEASILERRDDELRFRHDRLREGVLATLTGDEKERLHARVAEALDARGAVDPEQYATLAHHFGQAANRERAAHYAALAGEYALLHGAVREAIDLLEKAREGLVGIEDPLAVGRVCVLLSDACFFMTDLERSKRYAAQAAAAVGVRFPVGAARRGAALLWQLALHVAYRVVPGLPREPASRATTRVGSIAAGCAACVSISLGDALGVLLYALLAWNLAERSRYPDLWASGILGYGLASLGFPGLARSYFEPTGRGARALEGSYPILKTSFLLGAGDIPAAEQLLREELELGHGTGFAPGEAFSWFLLGYCAYYRGELEEAERRFSLAVKAEGTRANFAPGLSLVQISIDRWAEAEALLEQALEPQSPAVPRSIAYGVLALLHARRGDAKAALQAADTAVALARRSTTFGYAGAAFFPGVFEAYLAELAQAKRDGRPTGASLRRLRGVVSHCRAWSRAFRVGQPLCLLYESRLARLLGRPKRARRLCRRSGEVARGLGLGLYVTLAAREAEPADAPDVERRARAKSAT